MTTDAQTDRDGQRQARLAIATCGAIAREIMADPGELRVIAAFDHACYLACPRGIVCIGGEDIAKGPINVSVAMTRPWATLGVAVDDIGLSHGASLVIEDRLTLDATSGATWQPLSPPPFTPAIVRQGLTALQARAAPKVPGDGLACLAFAKTSPHAENRTARAAQGQVRDLIEALSDETPSQARRDKLTHAAILLIGLGPGFRPSGDSFLAGVFLALTVAGQDRLRDALWLALEPELAFLTNPPSAMHLSAAADGMSEEPVHHLVNAILSGQGDAIGWHFDAAVQCGDTSGWETLAGLSLALRALAAQV
ncbi:MAG: DUF2877 domain-containing protein [Hyphomicrobiaceae bacterium]